MLQPAESSVLVVGAGASGPRFNLRYFQTPASNLEYSEICDWIKLRKFRVTINNTRCCKAFKNKRILTIAHLVKRQPSII